MKRDDIAKKLNAVSAYDDESTGIVKEELAARKPIHTFAFQYFSDVHYWEVLYGVLAEEYGEKQADDLLNPYLFLEKEKDHVFPSWRSSGEERPDTLVYDFSFDIPQSVFLKLSKRSMKCHFKVTHKWRTGIRRIPFQCSSRKISQDVDSWKEFPEKRNNDKRF